MVKDDKDIQIAELTRLKANAECARHEAEAALRGHEAYVDKLKSRIAAAGLTPEQKAIIFPYLMPDKSDKTI